MTKSAFSLIECRGDLVLAALCVGQFRTPCQIEADRLIVRADAPLMAALRALGIEVSPQPEGAAFTPAPNFAPEGAHQHPRAARTHVSRHHDDEAPDEDFSPGSNA